LYLPNILQDIFIDLSLKISVFGRKHEDFRPLKHYSIILHLKLSQTSHHFQNTIRKRPMRSITELFEFLSNCNKETILAELNDHCNRLVQKNGTKSTRPFKIDIENLNTLFRMSEWYMSEELPKLIDELNPKPEVDELMTVEEVAQYLKVTQACVYNLIKKGKLKKIEISTVDKPGARPAIRIWKSEVDRFLDGK
jgi:excisionase family DNA binding protein